MRFLREMFDWKNLNLKENLNLQKTIWKKCYVCPLKIEKKKFKIRGATEAKVSALSIVLAALNFRFLQVSGVNFFYCDIVCFKR